MSASFEEAYLLYHIQNNLSSTFLKFLEKFFNLFQSFSFKLLFIALSDSFYILPLLIPNVNTFSDKILYN